MRPTWLLLLLALWACNSSSEQQAPAEETQPAPETAPTTRPGYPTIGSIEVLDPALNELIPAGAQIEVLAYGFQWAEGPVWVEPGGYLLFSDIPANTVYRWDEAKPARIYLKPSGYTGTRERGGEMGANALLLDSQGRLVLCQHGDRRLAYMDAPLNEPQATFVTLADRWQGKRFNSPNDATFHSSGALYFTDPPYGLVKQERDPAREIPFQGVYRLLPDGTVELLIRDLSRPNGIAFSPDEKTLYVANSDPKRAVIMAYEVDTEGKPHNGRVFHDFTALVGQEPGLPDGMKVNAEGILFATAPGGVWVFSPEGKALGVIRTTHATANCAFGNGGRMLYMTASSYLLRVPLKG
ncbi:MAG: SMP-30/gluconolactonase/LRE family protein [Bacteroidetes bacterium]|nr:MAG: SMP-30/gluconolactonase/LRE family protein [Bacteroidota bacterium]